MEITLSFIADWLREKHPEVRVFEQRSKQIRGVKLYKNNNSEMREDICYLGEAVEREAPVDCSYSYILVGQDDERYRYSDRIVLLYSGNVAEVYEEVMEIFFCILKWCDTLRRKIEIGTSVQEMLELSKDIFGNNPMVVHGASMQILGYMQAGGSGRSRVYQRNLGGQDFFIDIEDSDKKTEEIQSRMKQGVQTFFSTAKALEKDVRTLHSALYSKNGYLYGWITIAEYETKLSYRHEILVNYLAKLIQEFLEKDVLSLNLSGTSGSSFLFLLNLMTGEKIDSKEFAKNIQRLGWSSEDRYQILCLECDGGTLNSWNELYDLNLYFSYPQCRSYILLIEKTIVIICSRSDGKEVISRDRLEKLPDMLERKSCRCGMSMEFSDLECASRYYQQAVYAMKNGCGIVRHYQDYIVDDILESHVLRYGFRGNIHPDIAALAEYDKDNKSSLIRTLYYYLLCDRSFERCSAIMNVHRSTFRYRLSTIWKIIQADVNDPETRLALLISARLFLGKD